MERVCLLILVGAVSASACAVNAPLPATAAHASPAAPSTPPASTAAEVHSDPLGPVYSKGLEGDMRAGLAVLRATPLEALDAKQRAQRECLLRRFAATEPPPQTGAALVNSALVIYRDYWKRVLLQELGPAEGDTLLESRLDALLVRDGAAARAPSLDALTDALRAKLAAAGLHSLGGITRPYRELMVWRTETPRTYEVTLPDGPATVDVVLMRDFVSLGWSAYPTCDRAHTGGWAEKDKLYCVADSYDLASEDFKVSYLTHEANHFADYKRFPKLDQPELEYRAKLAELIASRETTRHLVERFAAESGGRRSSPHSFANGHVVGELARALGTDTVHPERWSNVADEAIRAAAAKLYKANTELLSERGAATVEKVLGQ